MPNTQKLLENKEKLVSLIKIKGPSLPINLARLINEQPLFTSAFLAELLSDKRLKISNMKVGSSPLYYLEGQEAMLENFVEYLSPREKEAFHILKQERVVRDQDLSPVTRVAIRAIPDFAVSVQVRIAEDITLFWKYFNVSDTEMHESIRKITTTPRGVLTYPQIAPKQNTQEQDSQQKTPEPKKSEQSHSPEPEQVQQLTPQKPKKPVPESEFTAKIKEYLKTKDIEVLETLLEKKKEFTAKVRIDSLFGKQSYYLIAKEKKKITENDLRLALQKAQAERMPALILSQGELDKKAQIYRREWHNILKFERVNP